MVLILTMVDREARRYGLHVQRLGFCRGVRLAGLLARLKAGDIFGTAQRRQLAGLSGVEYPVGSDHPFRPGRPLAQAHRAHPVRVAERRDSHVADQDLQAATRAMRREHPLQDRERDPRLVR
jgi:hypothetical protein